MRKKLKASFETAGNLQTEAMERLQKVDKDIGEYTVSGLFDSLFEHHSGRPGIPQYLTDLK
ncbi:MAG: hypothetical protein R6U85_02005, partial [Salinivirgaceae bacterium]